jgi:ParB family transcriptional regulator, chromosome partitioning protein
VSTKHSRPRSPAPSEELVTRPTRRWAGVQRSDAPASVPGPELRRIRLAQIDVPPVRIRRELGAVEDLAYSVGSIGLLHPVHVYRVRTRYRLISGERRLEAARLLGWTEIEAMVREPSDNHLLLELVENTQRKWLTDIEEADALIRLVREMGHEAKEVAAQSGRSEPYVSKRIRVFEDRWLRQAVEQDQLSVSVAEEFLALPPEAREPLVAEAIDGGWDGRRARETVRARLQLPPPAAGGSNAPTPATLAELAFIDATFGEADAADAGLEPEVPNASSRGRERVARSGRPNELSQSIRGLTRILRAVRAVDLNAGDERALAELLQTLLRLARAHARKAQGIVFPSLEEAERKARRG